MEEVTVRGTEAWFEAVIAGLVPTTPEAEELLRLLEQSFVPSIKRKTGTYLEHVGVHDVVTAYQAVKTVSGVAKRLGVSRAVVRDRLKKGETRT